MSGPKSEPAAGMPAPGAISYEDSKRLARDDDPAVRARLAARDDLRPELLYFLAEDRDPLVRRRAAANPRTPHQADLLLARDDDERVRLDLARKVERLLPHLEPGALRETQAYVIEVIEVLARDQAVRVRQLLSETLSGLETAPRHVIQALARDVEDAVACPPLEFSPLLGDEDLLEIIAQGCHSGRLRAISRRDAVNADVADAIMRSGDEAAITDLLANASAQIREDTLDRAIKLAPRVKAWQRPLVERPDLSAKAIRRLAGFVERALLDILERRPDLDARTAKTIAREVTRRLKEGGPAAEDAADPAARARRLFITGHLDDAAISEALADGERGFVRAALALKANVPVELVDRILSARSAKGVTALAWKAGCGMRLASQLQLRAAGIPPTQVLHPRDGSDYPLSADEIEWQWDFFRSLGG